MSAQTTNPTRDARIQEHLPMARRIAGAMARRIPSSFPREDLESAAYLGLTEAACRYDDSRGETFCAYAAKWIRGAILDELRRRDVMPRRSREKAKRLARATRSAEARFGGPVTSEQLAEAMGMTMEELQQARFRFRVPTMMALDEARDVPLHGAEGGIEDQIENRQRARAVAAAFASLSRRDRMILDMYYRQSRNLKEIGEALGVTESRVCQLRTRAEKTLRKLVLGRPTRRAIAAAG